jgi:hypothetical protein
LSSNALLENGSEYFFDTNDPQIFIHFDAFTPIQIEEVRIQLDYLTGGLQAALDLLKQKTTIFSEHQQALQHKQGEALATNPSV